jgi:prepilin-type N-terminal cleavage/methylation domain-containing protein
MARREKPPIPAADPRPGFTLVELMVTIVIIAILASLSLAGLGVTRGRAKADATRSTIRKLNEIIIPHYESYMRRRVRPVGADKRAIALNRLTALRELLTFEMPDNWADVASTSAATATVSGAAIPAASRTATVRAYGAYYVGLNTPAGARLETKAGNAVFTTSNGAAECLHMIVARGGFEPDILEAFRSDEIGDSDGDGVPEFIDGWGQPIAFLRWAPGFTPYSLVQNAAETVPGNGVAANPDPFDPFRVDAAYTLGTPMPAYALVPLIVSAGPDTTLGLQMASGWSSLLPLSTVVQSAGSTVGAATGINSTEHVDNISNHTFAAE